MQSIHKINNSRTISNTLSFGKIDYNRTGRRINAVELEITYDRLDTDKPYFAVSADVWNSHHTDIIAGGQCLEMLYNNFVGLRGNKKFNTIYQLWKKYHLHDMHAGTPAQEEALKECNERDYNKQLKFLETKNLKIDHGYTYGTSWLYQPIPADDLATIKDIILNW